jgi:hypothetical protein
MEEALAWLVYTFADIALVGTGHIVVRLLSMGRWRGQSWEGREARTFSAAGSLWFKHEGRLIITTTGLLLVGAAFYVSAGIGAWCVSRLF